MDQQLLLQPAAAPNKCSCLHTAAVAATVACALIFGIWHSQAISSTSSAVLSTTSASINTPNIPQISVLRNVIIDAPMKAFQPLGASHRVKRNKEDTASKLTTSIVNTKDESVVQRALGLCIFTTISAAVAFGIRRRTPIGVQDLEFLPLRLEELPPLPSAWTALAVQGDTSAKGGQKSAETDRDPVHSPLDEQASLKQEHVTREGTETVAAATSETKQDSAEGAAPADTQEDDNPFSKAFKGLQLQVSQATVQVQEAFKEGLERDRKAREAFTQTFTEVMEDPSTDITLVRDSAEAFYELALNVQTAANDALAPLFKAINDTLKNPVFKELEDIVPLPLITWYSLRTKGYAGDISPKRASRILRQRSDAILLDIRDLKQVKGERGSTAARGVPDLRLGARGKGILLNKDTLVEEPTPDPNVIDVTKTEHREDDAPQIHVMGPTEETVVVIMPEEEGVRPASASGSPPTANDAPAKDFVFALDGASISQAAGAPGQPTSNVYQPEVLSSSTSAAPSTEKGTETQDLVVSSGALVAQDRKAMLARQSEVISGMKQVSDGKLIIILDQDGTDSAELARLLKENGIEKPYVVRGGYEEWVENGLRTKDGVEYDSSPWQVLAEELEALFEDTENIFDLAQELSRSDVGKAGLVVVGGVTVWAVLFNAKLAFELFVCVLILDQIGSSWDREPASVWVKMQRIQQRFSQFADGSMQLERLRAELAEVYGQVKEKEKAAREEKDKARAKGKLDDASEEEIDQAKRIELLKEEIERISEKEGSLLGELKAFLSSTAGKSQAALALGLGSVVVTHSDDLFNAAVVLLFIKLLLDRVTTRAEKKQNPMFVEFEKMVQRDRDGRAKKLLS